MTIKRCSKWGCSRLYREGLERWAADPAHRELCDRCYEAARTRQREAESKLESEYAKQCAAERPTAPPEVSDV